MNEQSNQEHMAYTNGAYLAWSSYGKEVQCLDMLTSPDKGVAQDGLGL